MQTVQIRRGRSKSRSQGGAPTASPAQCIIVGSKEIPYPAKKSRRKVWNRTKQGISELVHRNNMGLLNNGLALPLQPPEKGSHPTSTGAGSVRSGDKETPPLCPSSCNGDAGGAGSNQGTHGRGGHFQHGGPICGKMALNGYVLHVWPLGHPGAGVPPAAERQQPQPSSDPCEHLRRHLPPRDQGPATGLRRPLGGRFPIFWKSCPRLFLYKKRAGKNPAPFFSYLFLQ